MTDIAAHTSEWLARRLGRRFNRSDQNNLLEVREPARKRDVALQIGDPGQESSGDLPDSSDLSGVRTLTLSELLSSPPAH